MGWCPNRRSWWSAARHGTVEDLLLRVAEVLAAVVEVDVAAFLAGQQAGLVVVPLILGELDVFHGAVGQVAGYV